MQASLPPHCTLPPVLGTHAAVLLTALCGSAALVAEPIYTSHILLLVERFYHLVYIHSVEIIYILPA